MGLASSQSFSVDQHHADRLFSDAPGGEPARSAPLSGQDELEHLDAWWRAANYLAVGMIYLQDNPLHPGDPGGGPLQR